MGLSIVLVVGLCPGVFQKTHFSIILWVIAGCSLQGCAVELAKLNNRPFAAHDGSTHAQGYEPEAASVPFNVSDAPDATSLTGTRLLHPANPELSLSGEINTMLDRFSYSSNREGDPDPAVQLEVAQASTLAGKLAGSAYQAGKTYSINVANASIQPVLLSLAIDAGLELHSHGPLDEHITASIDDKPLELILAVLAEQADFVWHIQNDVLTVRNGEAYGYTYPVNYLNIERRTQSSVGLATQVGTINASDTAGNSIANSSQTRIENVSEHHFWQSLESDVLSIIKQEKFTNEGTDSDLAVNRDAGLLTLFATPSVHRALKQYLKRLHSSVQRQVLIEATVVEVALSRNFEAGVDWQLIANGISGINAAQILVGAPTIVADTVDRLTAPAGLVSLVQTGSRGDVSATLSLLEQFGDVRILSRPRIIAMNNQSSVLKVVDNRVYFTLNVQRRQTEDKDEIITETEIHTVPVGLVMNVTPQISQSGTVMLNVRPTLSRILGFVNDPNPELALANVRNGVPEIQVREMESMLQVQSGDVAIIGGLMQETQSGNDAQLPGLGRIPLIGKLFSKQSRDRRQTELLIVLRPTVLESGQRP